MSEGQRKLSFREEVQIVEVIEFVEEAERERKRREDEDCKENEEDFRRLSEERRKLRLRKGIWSRVHRWEMYFIKLDLSIHGHLLFGF